MKELRTYHDIITNVAQLQAESEVEALLSKAIPETLVKLEINGK